MNMDDGLMPTVDRETGKGRGDFYARVGTQHLAPLWKVLQ
jgi:hypothetical protein